MAEFGGRVAFSAPSARNGVQQVFLLHSNGAVTQLTHGRRPTAVEGWSPDGQRLIVDRDFPVPAVQGGGRVQSLFVVGASGTSFQRLTNGSWAGNAQWSPDHSRVAFEGAPAVGAAWLETAVWHGGKLQAIGKFPWSLAGSSSWSPDASKILISKGTGHPYMSDLYTASFDGTNISRVTHSDPSTCIKSAGPPGVPDCEFYSEAAWSPTGAEIVAIHSIPNPSGHDIQQLVVIHRLGSGAWRTTALGPSGFAPSWSPTGAQISFLTSHGIYTMAPNSHNVRRLTTLSGITSANWAPDGSKLAFWSGCTLYTITTDSSVLTKLDAVNRPYAPKCKRSIAHESGPIWQPTPAPPP